jgi:hypothetical protein
MPVHIYQNVSIVDGCFAPADDIAVIAAQTDNDPNYDISDFTVPDTGLVYLRIHLDYGLKKTAGYTREGDNATHNGDGIDNGTDYEFKVSVSDDIGMTDSLTIENQNVFKHDPGFAGIVTSISTGDPVSGVTIQIYDPAKKLLATVKTDEDGFYFFNYKHKGKAATYTVKLPAYGLSKTVTVKANALVAVDFEIP